MGAKAQQINVFPSEGKKKKKTHNNQKEESGAIEKESNREHYLIRRLLKSKLKKQPSVLTRLQIPLLHLATPESCQDRHLVNSKLKLYLTVLTALYPLLL